MKHRKGTPFWRRCAALLTVFAFAFSWGLSGAAALDATEETEQTAQAGQESDAAETPVLPQEQTPAEELESEAAPPEYQPGADSETEAGGGDIPEGENPEGGIPNGGLSELPLDSEIIDGMEELPTPYGGGGLSVIEVGSNTGVDGKEYTTGSTNWTMTLPWEGDGKVWLIVTPISGNTPAITFNGEAGTELVPGQAYPIQSPVYTVDQGECLKVVVKSVGAADGKPQSTDTVTYQFYRTNARVELKASAPDENNVIRAELWAYNCMATQVATALRFDPAVLQLCAPNGTANDSLSQHLFFEDGDYVAFSEDEGKPLSLMTVSNKIKHRADNTAGQLRLNFSAETSGKCAPAGPEGIRLYSVYFKLNEENAAALSERSLYFDAEDSVEGDTALKYANGCQMYVVDMPNVTDTPDPGAAVFDGVLSYANLASVTGLQGVLEKSVSGILDLAEATVERVDVNRVRVVYRDGEVLVDWPAGGAASTEIGTDDPITLTISSKSHLITGLLCAGGGTLPGAVHTKTYGAWLAEGNALVKPVFLADTLPNGAPFLERMAKLKPEKRPLDWADGQGSGFVYDRLTYSLTLVGKEDEASFSMMVQPGASASVAVLKADGTEQPGKFVDEAGAEHERLTGENAEMTWTARTLQAGDRLRVTVTGPAPEEGGEVQTTIYIIELRHQELPEGARLLLEQQTYPGLTKATLYLTAESCQGVQVELALPEGLVPAGANGAALDFAAQENHSAALESGAGLSSMALKWNAETRKLYAASALTGADGGAADEPSRGLPMENSPVLAFYLLDINAEPLTLDTLVAQLQPVVLLAGGESGELTVNTPVEATDLYTLTLRIASNAPRHETRIKAYYRATQDEPWPEEAQEIHGVLPVWTAEANESNDTLLGERWKGNGRGTGYYTQTFSIPGLKNGFWKFEIDKPGQTGVDVLAQIDGKSIDGTKQLLKSASGMLHAGGGIIGMSDYRVLASVIGRAATPELQRFDLDGDGYVRPSDLAIMTRPQNLGHARESVLVTEGSEVERG